MYLNKMHPFIAKVVKPQFIPKPYVSTPSKYLIQSKKVRTSAIRLDQCIVATVFSTVTLSAGSGYFRSTLIQAIAVIVLINLYQILMFSQNTSYNTSSLK